MPAGKGLSAQTLSHYGVVLTTYATMALEAPRREGAGAGGKKGAAGKAAGLAVGGAAVGGAGAAAGVGAAGEGDDDVVDLLSDSEEAGPSQQAQQPGAKRQKGAGGKAVAGGGGRSKEGGPLHQIYWHRCGDALERAGVASVRAGAQGLPRLAARIWQCPNASALGAEH